MIRDNITDKLHDCISSKFGREVGAGGGPVELPVFLGDPWDDSEAWDDSLIWIEE